MHMGLQPYLRELGMDDKFSQKAFTSVERYVDFLLGEENKVNQRKVNKALHAPTTWITPPTFPVPPQQSPRPYFPQQNRVNMITNTDSYDPLEENLEVQIQWTDPQTEPVQEYEDEEPEDVTVVGAVRSRTGQFQKSNSGARYAGKSATPVPTVTYINGAGQTASMKATDAKLAFSFPAPDATWPTNFHYTPDMAILNLGRMSNSDRILKVVQVLDPLMSSSKVLTVYQRMANHEIVSPSFSWCIIHGVTAHTTLECPCVSSICPRTRLGKT
jgi:hypothetical protein